MGFLIKLWHVISTVVVLIPKVWPIVKIGLSKLWDVFLNRKLAEKKKEELEQAVKVAKETGDTEALEAHLSMGDAESVSVDEVVPTVLADSAEPAIEEKKSPNLEEISNSKTTGSQISSETDSSTLLSTVGKIAAAGAAFYILDALFSKKEAKAASVNSVIIDGSGSVKSYSIYKGTFRMRSTLLP